jgi:hypothetical protein
MEEILASIRRIIADEPGKVLRNEPPRSHALHQDAVREDGTGIENRFKEDIRRENLRNEMPPYDVGDPMRATERRPIHPIDEDTGQDRGQDTGQETSEATGHEALFPQPADGPPSSARVGPREPAEMQAELEAMLSELQAESRQASDAVEEPAADIFDSTEPTEAAEPLPEAELFAGDEAVRGDDEVEEVEEEEAAPHPMPATRAASSLQMLEQERAVERAGARQAARELPNEALISAATSAAVDSASSSVAQTCWSPERPCTLGLIWVRNSCRPMLKTRLSRTISRTWFQSARHAPRSSGSPGREAGERP